mmetsp:Transcript_9922/g.16323  ORF Transcript_9922/g.16323 Transcript_9922/m.16323 type:complete len:204 (-) Transcript_9922:573-1184(-)
MGAIVPKPGTSTMPEPERSSLRDEGDRFVVGVFRPELSAVVGSGRSVGVAYPERSAWVGVAQPDVERQVLSPSQSSRPRSVANEACVLKENWQSEPIDPTDTEPSLSMRNDPLTRAPPFAPSAPPSSVTAGAGSAKTLTSDAFSSICCRRVTISSNDGRFLGLWCHDATMMSLNWGNGILAREGRMPLKAALKAALSGFALVS